MSRRKTQRKTFSIYGNFDIAAFVPIATDLHLWLHTWVIDHRNTSSVTLLNLNTMIVWFQFQPLPIQFEYSLKISPTFPRIQLGPARIFVFGRHLRADSRQWAASILTFQQQRRSAPSPGPVKLGPTEATINGGSSNLPLIALLRVIHTLTHYSDIVSKISCGSISGIYIYVCFFWYFF